MGREQCGGGSGSAGGGSSGVLLLPVFPGPRHAFYGCGMGLGMKSWEGLPREIAAPEVPLREAFEEIRARGGLAVYKDLGGGKQVDIRRDILSLFPRLEKTGFYPQGSGTARLYAATELPYDTVAGPAYDVIALDGSAAAEQLWFNLLNQGYRVSVIGAGGGSLEGGRLPYGQTFVGRGGAAFAREGGRGHPPGAHGRQLRPRGLLQDSGARQGAGVGAAR